METVEAICGHMLLMGGLFWIMTHELQKGCLWLYASMQVSKLSQETPATNYGHFYSLILDCKRKKKILTVDYLFFQTQ